MRSAVFGNKWDEAKFAWLQRTLRNVLLDGEEITDEDFGNARGLMAAYLIGCWDGDGWNADQEDMARLSTKERTNGNQ